MSGKSAIKFHASKGQFGHRERFIQNSEIKYSTVT